MFVIRSWRVFSYLNLPTPVYVYIYTCIYTHVHTKQHMYIYIYIYVYTHMYIRNNICISIEQGSFCDVIFVSVFAPYLPRMLCVWQCVAVCCSTGEILSSSSVCCSVSQHVAELQCVAVREGPRPHKQCAVVCYSVLQCIVVYCSVLQCERERILINSVSQCVAMCCSVLQCVAVCCSVLQCVEVCCSALRGSD